MLYLKILILVICTAVKFPDINFGIFYHIEDVGLPIASNEFNNRESESIHIGIDYQYFLNSFHFSSEYFLESGLMNYSNNIEYFSEVFLINTSYEYNSIKLGSKIYKKSFSTSIDDSLFLDRSIDLFNFTIGPEFERSFLK